MGHATTEEEVRTFAVLLFERLAEAGWRYHPSVLHAFSPNGAAYVSFSDGNVRFSLEAGRRGSFNLELPGPLSELDASRVAAQLVTLSEGDISTWDAARLVKAAKEDVLERR
jgi:hypothetical protein